MYIFPPQINIIIFWFPSSKFPWEGGREGVRKGGWTNTRPGTDHVVSEPMRGHEKNAPNGSNRQTDIQTDIQTNGYGNSMSKFAKLGRFSEEEKNLDFVFGTILCDPKHFLVVLWSVEHITLRRNN